MQCSIIIFKHFLYIQNYYNIIINKIIALLSANCNNVIMHLIMVDINVLLSWMMINIIMGLC